MALRNRQSPSWTLKGRDADGFWNSQKYPVFETERRTGAPDLRLVKLPYVTLWAVKFDETKRIYKEILNLPVAEESENFIMFDTKTYRLGLHRLSKKSPALNRDTVELHLEASDVDQVYQSLRSKGVKFHDAPANRPWGTRMAAFKDPEGYTVEIVGPLKDGETTKSDKPAHMPGRDE